jgi:metallo-beta-lactamase family protein
MQIGFHGAAGQVTGSKHLISLDNGKRILLDCGMFQGEGPETFQMNAHFGFPPHTINYLILSHAHIDHCGLIPRLVAEGFRGKIFTTAATRDLCAILLEDSAGILEEEANDRDRKPLFTMENVKEALGLFRDVKYGVPLQIEEGVELLLTDAGHILGSACVNLKITENDKTTHILFSGDVGRYNSRLLRDPQPCPQADIIICESTYGDTIHQTRDEAEEILKTVILETCGLKKGKVIIPAFSVGRTQDLIYLLNKLDFEKKIPADTEVFIDSPLAIDATEVVSRHQECFDEETLAFMKKDSKPFDFDSLTFVKRVQDSIALNDYEGPCVIIASSGMMEAGRIRHHLAHTLGDEKNTILINSYADPDSLGGRLKAGDKEVEIWDKMFTVKADVIVMDALSAHADRDELLRFLSSQDKKQVTHFFLVHGEEKVRDVFRERLIQEGFSNVHLPERGEVVQIDESKIE